MASTGAVFPVETSITSNISDGEVLRYEFNSNYISKSWLPEHYLMLAILQDALHSILNGRGTGRQQAQAWADGRAWVASNDEIYTFSFNSVWSTLFGAAGWSAQRAKNQILNDPQGVLRRIKKMRIISNKRKLIIDSEEAA